MRVAAIDWAMLETALALGITPVAATELVRFRVDAVTPAVPATVVDLGLRGSPNLELLITTAPDVILTSPWYAFIEHRLASVAKLVTHTVYTPGEPPWPKALAALRVVGQRLGVVEHALAVEAQTKKTIAMRARALRPYRDRPCYIVQIGDARHVRMLGDDSLFGSVLMALGLQNAWEARSRFSFAAPVPIEQLATTADARILVVSEVPALVRDSLAHSTLWRRLTPVAESRVHFLDNINPFGGVPAGLRFAALLHRALTAP